MAADSHASRCITKDWAIDNPTAKEGGFPRLHEVPLTDGGIQSVPPRKPPRIPLWLPRDKFRFAVINQKFIHGAIEARVFMTV